jgi:DNA-binding MarR family transcriptional regulator
MDIAAVDLSACRGCLGTASRRAARGVSAVYDRSLRPHGLRTTQFTLLTNLMLRGPTSMGALAKALGMDRTTLTRNVAVLEGAGWAQIRTDDTDARSHIVSVTEAGREVVSAAFPAWRQAQDVVAAAFGPAGVAALYRLAGTQMP